MGKPQKKRSLAWHFFEFSSDTQTVTCSLCTHTFKHCGGTTNLRSHLARKHPIQWQLAANGSIDDSLLNRTNEDEDETCSETTIRILKEKFEQSETDIEDEHGVDSVYLETIRDSDEEWLEENEIQKPKQKKKKSPKKRIKQEPFDIDDDIQIHPKRYRFVQNPVTRNSNKQKTDITKDEHTSFGEYIGNRIRNIKDSKTRGNVQQMITTILWQAEYGVYNDPEAVKRILMTPIQPSTLIEPQASIVISYTDQADNIVVENQTN